MKGKADGALQRFGVLAILLILALVAGTLTWVGSRTHASAAPASKERCPETVLVVARGTYQNEILDPLYYSPSQPPSNGWEGKNLRGLIEYASEIYTQETGQNLYQNTRIEALSPELYPAEIPVPDIAEEGENLTPLEFFRRVFGVLKTDPLGTIVYEAISGFLRSVQTTNIGIPLWQEDFEQRSGCEPEYVLLGYSQGALALQRAEKHFYDTGRLRGVLYMGDPYADNLNPAYAATVYGAPTSPLGILGWEPWVARPWRAPVPRANLCEANDFVCDTSLASISQSLVSGGGVHADYFYEGPLSPAEEGFAQAMVSMLRP